MHLELDTLYLEVDHSTAMLSREILHPIAHKLLTQQ